MTQEKEADLVLDLKGLVCPMPVVRVSQAMKRLDVGAVIEAVATDPAVVPDMRAWARTTGNELLSMEQSGGLFTFRLRKVK